MKRIQLCGAAFAASLTLAACGGSAETSTPPTRSDATVDVKSVGGVDDVLVDAAGKPLYAADVEAKGAIKCVGACVSFWTPLTITGTPTAASSQVGKLGIVERPDGTRQVTARGKPLYTFSEDGAGQVNGDGFEDEFGGRHFKWSAVLAGGGSSKPSSAKPAGGAYGYGGS